MKNTKNLRSLISIMVAMCLLSAPILAVGKKKGEKNYKRGLQYESAQQWEQAAQEFTLAVAANPSDTTYQLHYRRAVFNASQSFMVQGRALAEQRDYVGAYNAFRQAYGYDPVNQLALSEMDRMLRLQAEREGTTAPLPGADRSGAKISPASYQQDNGGGTPAVPQNPRNSQDTPLVSPGTQQLKVINYNGDLKAFIRSLADQLNLNVVFDRQSFAQPRQIDVNFKDVTTAQALDYVFLQENLFFQKLNRRTILVADQNRRPQYQQLVLRTFYLANMDPTDASNLIQRAIPASQGRPQPIVIPDKLTNSITVRDTSENIQLIGDLIQSIDKDRAEVVMDVNIYEVSRTDLLQLGNQIGSSANLTNIGFTSGGIANRGLGSRLLNPTAVGIGLALPQSQIAALQSKNHTKLIASTQVHAFNGEESSARIGQRVPVQTASAFPFGFQNNTGNTVPNNVFPGGGYPVINYEPTGLTLKFTPQVFPNLDVQVKMSIESKDVLAGSTPNTPTFTERTITGTARIQNNRTMMLASVAQDRQSNGREGLPVLGLVPVLGRLFTAPRRDDFQTDIVIAVTPRVLRAPAVTPRDEEQRPSGTLQTPTNGSLEAMVRESDREDQALAAARRIPNNVVVQLPDMDVPYYVPAPKALAAGSSSGGAANAPQGALAVSKALAVKDPIEQSARANLPQLIGVSAKSEVKAAELSSNRAVDLAAAIKALAPDSEPPVYLPALKPRMILPPSANSQAIDASAKPLTETLDSSKTPAIQRRTEKPVNQLGAQAPAVLTRTPKPSASAASNNALRPAGAAAKAELRLMPEREQMRVGEKQRLSLVLITGSASNLASFQLQFDPTQVIVRGVSQSLVLASGHGAPTITQSVDAKGVLTASIAPFQGATLPTGANVLLFVDVEAVGAGNLAADFDPNNVRLTTPDGRNLPVHLVGARFVVNK